jgi:hypothetical protein
MEIDRLSKSSDITGRERERERERERVNSLDLFNMAGLDLFSPSFVGLP